MINEAITGNPNVTGDEMANAQIAAEKLAFEVRQRLAQEIR